MKVRRMANGEGENFAGRRAKVRGGSSMKRGATDVGPGHNRGERAKPWKEAKLRGLSGRGRNY